MVKHMKGGSGRLAGYAKPADQLFIRDVERISCFMFGRFGHGSFPLALESAGTRAHTGEDQKADDKYSDEFHFMAP